MKISDLNYVNDTPLCASMFSRFIVLVDILYTFNLNCLISYLDWMFAEPRYGSQQFHNGSCLRTNQYYAKQVCLQKSLLSFAL